MPYFWDLPPDELKTWLRDRGQAEFRAAQIQRWLCARHAADYEQMTDLPAALRQQLAAELPLWSTQIVQRSTADDTTEKLLLALADGQRIECVLIRHGPRRTMCLSTQVGCAMGCVFCASGLDGVARNLTRGEIVEQMLQLGLLLGPDERLSHVVVMGMGEPLANLNQLLPALEVATAPQGLGISPRRVTISTVGLPPAIDRLAKADCPYHLAVSLHAPSDALRTRIIPTNRQTGLAEILAAADRYFATTGRRVTYEYILLGGLNDAPQHARELVRLLHGRNALVNVIPYNPVAGLPYVTPGDSAREAFLEVLRTAGIQTQVRLRKGDRIQAACGQLRRSFPAPADALVTLPPAVSARGPTS